MKKINIILISLLLFFCIIPLNFVKAENDTNDNVVGIEYCSHIQDIGWENDFSKKNGQLSGTEGKSKRLESVKIKLINKPVDLDIKYQTHIQNIGWQDWKQNGELSGTEGKSLRLEAIKIQLSNNEKYEVQYRVHIQNIGWQGWKQNGEIAGTEGKSLRLEAIEIKIIDKTKASIQYYSHIQNYDWEKAYSKNDGELSGTEGKGLRLEAIKIQLATFDNSLSVKYQTHIQNIGWQGWKQNGETSGVTGQGLRLEAIKIELNQNEKYSVMYRVHIQDIGWQEWKQDGQVAGTTGRNLRIEAIQIKLVPKQTNTIKKGIDISTFQKNIDWKKVKEDGVDFAMIRAGFRGYGVSSDGVDGKLVVDDYFRTNINGAISNNVEVGVYFFTQAINEKEAIEEANYTLSLVKGYNITYPIAIDTEYSSHPARNGRADKLTVEQRTNVVKAFCETIKNAGYTPMIYASKRWLKDNLDMNRLQGYSIWLAHYTGATQDDPLAKPSDYDGEYIMWQYTDKGTVNGIIGNVDMNIRKLRDVEKIQVIY